MRAYEIRVNEQHEQHGGKTLSICEEPTSAAARAEAERVKGWLSFLFHGALGELEVCETLSDEAVRRLRADAIARGDSELAARCLAAVDDFTERRALARLWLFALTGAERSQMAQFVRRGGGARAPFTRRRRGHLGGDRRGRSQHPVIARMLCRVSLGGSPKRHD